MIEEAGQSGVDRGSTERSSQAPFFAIGWILRGNRTRINPGDRLSQTTHAATAPTATRIDSAVRVFGLARPGRAKWNRNERNTALPSLAARGVAYGPCRAAKTSRLNQSKAATMSDAIDNPKHPTEMQTGMTLKSPRLLPYHFVRLFFRLAFRRPLNPSVASVCVQAPSKDTRTPKKTQTLRSRGSRAGFPSRSPRPPGSPSRWRAGPLFGVFGCLCVT